MKISYKEFLNAVGIISEKEYDKLMDSLPDLDFNTNNPEEFVDSLSDLGDADDIMYEYINGILPKPWGLSEIDRKNNIELYISESEIPSNKEKCLKQLETISREFRKKGYTISNYDKLVNEIYDSNKSNKVTNFINSLSFEDKIKAYDILNKEINL